MARRRQVLISAGPPLLGDLLRRELDGESVDVHMAPQRRWRIRPWDVAIVAAPAPRLRARCVVVLPDADFSAIVGIVRRLCGLRAAGPAVP